MGLIDSVRSGVTNLSNKAADAATTAKKAVAAELPKAAQSASASLFQSEKPKKLEGGLAKAALKVVQQQLKNNRPEALNPANAKTDGDKGGIAINKNNEQVRFYQTGDNITSVADGRFTDSSPVERAALVKKQTDLTAAMSEKLGKPVSNPPSLSDSKAYFKTLAGKGKPEDVENVKREYGKYLSAFYVHSGDGVDWGAGKNLANKLENSLKGQPRLKDGRQVIDCEGFAALTENLLGGIKEPGGKKPMFELMHVQNGQHQITGVFRKGSPPFIVSNNEVTDIPANKVKLATANNKGSSETAQRKLVRDEFKAMDVGDPQVYGPRMDDLKPPPG